VPTAPPTSEPLELNLLREWREPVTTRRFARDLGGSLLIHAAIIAFLLLAPDVVEYQPSPEILAEFQHPVTLVLPPMSELTQKAPNQGKVLKQLDLRSAVQAQPAQAPHVRQFTAPPGPASHGPDPAALQTSVVEAPQIQTGPIAPPIPGFGTATSGLSGAPTFPGPARANPAAPKAPPTPKIPDPIRDALRGGGGGLMVGDTADDSPRVPGVAPSECNECSALQLLSDPRNVDFKPYLLQVLAKVKRNWMTVIPASARSGRRGIVVLKFAINKQGAVPELEFTSPTGTELDRAAVAGISASVPFPPLPAEYGGDQIRLQMAFSYNMLAH